MAQTADQSLRHTISIRYLISFRTKISATESGDDNHASGNTAISLHRAEPKEVEGNVRPVSLVQEIFSDPAGLNLLQQGFTRRWCPRKAQGYKLCWEIRPYRSVQGSLGSWK